MIRTDGKPTIAWMPLVPDKDKPTAKKKVKPGFITGRDPGDEHQEPRPIDQETEYSKDAAAAITAIYTAEDEDL